MPEIHQADPHAELARQRLLEEGARSYIDAATALIEYEREVQKGCREVLEKYLEAYSGDLALDQPLTTNDIEELSMLNSKKWKGTSARVGVRIDRTTKLRGISWWGSSCSLDWEYSENADPWFGASVAVWMPQKSATLLLQRLRQLKAVNVDGSVRAAWIAQPLKIEEAAAFEEKLESSIEPMDSALEQNWRAQGALKMINQACHLTGKFLWS